MDVSVDLLELFDYLSFETLECAFEALLRQCSSEEYPELIETIKAKQDFREKAMQKVNDRYN